MRENQGSRANTMIMLHVSFRILVDVHYDLFIIRLKDKKRP